MNSKNTELDLTIDFRSDWTEILRQKLIEAGYSVDSNQAPDAICIQYFNTLKRRIEPRSRKVLIAKEFKCPTEHTEGVNIVCQKAESGEDLTPHLNKIHSPDDPDPLLNAWGIYHFHLGTLVDKSGFMKRTGPLLFARVTDDSFYMLDVLGHGSWYQQRLIDIIHNNWRESIEMYKIRGVDRLTIPLPTDEDVAKFRKSNINIPLQVSDGTIYAPLGGGQTISGIDLDVRVTCSCYRGTIRNLEKHVRNNLAHFRDIARQHDLELPPQPHFQLQLVDGNAYAVELNVRISYKLCEMPLQILMSL
ncbi:hypothetical protein B4U84_12235 [Westiellopsis prolifica IICB1]|nr:hypothetical protein B4U84_12235 [Westiellopsis prolifica IICB1]